MALIILPEPIQAACLTEEVREGRLIEFSCSDGCIHHHATDGHCALLNFIENQ